MFTSDAPLRSEEFIRAVQAKPSLASEWMLQMATRRCTGQSKTWSARLWRGFWRRRTPQFWLIIASASALSTLPTALAMTVSMPRPGYARLCVRVCVFLCVVFVTVRGHLHGYTKRHR